MEDYFFSTEEQSGKEKKAYVLIIYDIVDNSGELNWQSFCRDMVFEYKNRHLKR